MGRGGKSSTKKRKRISSPRVQNELTEEGLKKDESWAKLKKKFSPAEGGGRVKKTEPLLEEGSSREICRFSEDKHFKRGKKEH